MKLCPRRSPLVIGPQKRRSGFLFPLGASLNRRPVEKVSDLRFAALPILSFLTSASFLKRITGAANCIGDSVYMRFPPLSYAVSHWFPKMGVPLPDLLRFYFLIPFLRLLVRHLASSSQSPRRSCFFPSFLWLLLSFESPNFRCSPFSCAIRFPS